MSAPSPRTPPAPPPAAGPGGSGRPWVAGLAAVLLLAGLAAYRGSLSGPFVFDDTTAIPENPSIRSLWPPGHLFLPPPEATTVVGRPLANISLALNYAAGGLDVRGYHGFNLAVHLLAGLVLFGLARRTFLLPGMAGRFGGDATPLAAAVSGLWLLHPLQTESVTYVVQRVESMAGLFTLCVLYATVRSAGSRRPRAWQAAAVAACLLGVASKEVAATAPLAAFLYDRTFLAGSFSGAWRARRGLYVGLVLTWIPLAFLVAAAGWSRGGSAGFGSAPALPYWMTQLEAVCRYLRLCLWPRAQVFDYGSALLRDPGRAAACGAAVAALLAATAVALWRWPRVGFLGAWFFLTLAPSSLVPVATQTMAEHRTYLAVAAVAAGAVAGLYAAGGRRFLAVAALLAVAAGFLTARRNEVYRSSAALWADTAAKRPGNARAHNNLGLALFREGRTAAAIPEYERALALEPRDQGTHSNLGNALAAAGRLDEAAAHYRRAIEIQPDFAPAHYNLAKLLVREGKPDRAAAEYAAALRIQPTYPDAQDELGVLLASEPGRLGEATGHLLEAVRLNPGSAAAHAHLAEALARGGRIPEAVDRYREALRLDPHFAGAWYNLGTLLGAAGNLAEAERAFGEALRADPGYARAHFGLANTLVAEQRLPEAVREFEEAVRLDPGLAEAQTNLGMILCRSGRVPEGLQHLDAAIRANPAYPQAHFVRGIALALSGRRDDALAEYETLVGLKSPLAASLARVLGTGP